MSNAFSSVVGTGSTGTTGCGLKSITLDANKTNQTATARNWVHAGENYVVDDVWFINGYGGGIYTYYAGSDNVVEGFATKFKVYNYGAEWGCIGWEMHGPHDTQISNGTVSTLDSTIKNMNSGLTYGATPISGGVALPAIGTTFTFQCTSSDTAHFPTTGGVFLLPLASTNSNPPTWTLVTYTSATTPGGNQLFAGCTSLPDRELRPERQSRPTHLRHPRHHLGTERHPYVDQWYDHAHLRRPELRLGHRVGPVQRCHQRLHQHQPDRHRPRHHGLGHHHQHHERHHHPIGDHLHPDDGRLHLLRW